MVASPRKAIAAIAEMGGIALGESETAAVVEKMGKKWALEHIDPYHYAASTPFTPPDAKLASKSNFVVDSSKLTDMFDRLNGTQKLHVRKAYWTSVTGLTEGGDAVAASFYKENRAYFCEGGNWC